MPTYSPHPYVVWRNGRPRFSPGPELRAAGHKGRDLKHEDGRWYTRGEAIDWSRRFARELYEGRPAAALEEASEGEWAEPPASKARRGFIYFLGAGERIKIGWSSNPGMRLANLSTALTDPLEFFVCVPGTRQDERHLHRELRGSGTNGEWFKPNLSVVRRIETTMITRVERLRNGGEEAVSTAQIHEAFSHVRETVREKNKRSR